MTAPSDLSAVDRLGSYRRALQLGLGVMWLLDASLQLQPYMFTTAFPHDILAPVAAGNPGWVAAPVQWSAHLTAAHVVELNAGYATIQLLLALGLFTRSTVRLALAGSVMWGLGVWWLGEGLGGLLAGPQSPLMGAPGAALLYAVIAVLLWPPKEFADRGQPATPVSVATAGPFRVTGARLLWCALWFGFAVESLQSANRAPSALHDLVAGMQDGEPGWLRSLDQGAASALAGHGSSISVALALLFAAVGLAVFGGRRLARAGLLTAAGLAALVWVVGQNFGEIGTGQATDPNTGPMLILLAATYWPVRWRSAPTSVKSAPGAEDQLARVVSAVQQQVPAGYR